MMSLVINTNVQSINAQRLLGSNTRMLSKSMEKLASGYKINRASDDAAGMQISEIMRSQIRGGEQAFNNVQDGINLLNTVDGAYDTITSNLQRMRELTVQGANDTLAVEQRSSIDKEIQQLAKDVSRIANSTQFNNKNLMTGLASFRIQVGANKASATNVIDLATAGSNPFADSRATALGILGAADAVRVSAKTNVSALKSLSILDTALTSVNNRRAGIGALTNRLEGTANNLSIAIENFSSAESRIRNVDVAKESAAMTKNQILQQASSTILAQANQMPNLAMTLLRG
jgi:flagellin